LGEVGLGILGKVLDFVGRLWTSDSAFEVMEAEGVANFVGEDFGSEASRVSIAERKGQDKLVADHDAVSGAHGDRAPGEVGMAIEAEVAHGNHDDVEGAAGEIIGDDLAHEFEFFIPAADFRENIGC
jgi:hypothetical protein